MPQILGDFPEKATLQRCFEEWSEVFWEEWGGILEQVGHVRDTHTPLGELYRGLMAGMRRGVRGTEVTEVTHGMKERPAFFSKALS